jgi:hypothetical protein
MFRNNFVCFSSALVRRDVFKHVGLFDESLPLAIDYELWLRAASCYSFDYVDEPLVQYRTGHASLSRRTEERLSVVYGIMRQFLGSEENRRCLDANVVREATAETCYHIGLACRSRSRLAAIPWYLRCLNRSPSYTLAWQGLASLLLPENVRRLVRTALGRRPDWAVRQPVTVN